MTKQVSKSTTRSKKAKAKSTSKQKHKVQGRGYCIRCATGIDFSTDEPLCDKDYTIWAEYEDPEYAEEYCHSCGKEKDTSYTKPLCITCFKKIAKGADAPKRSVPFSGRVQNLSNKKSYYVKGSQSRSSRTTPRRSGKR